jgi:radical SAM protein with 4Fe4S-binding SPASM domain
VNCLIQGLMVGRLHDFVAFMQHEGVDAVYLSPPWFISRTTARLMDEYCETHFAWMRNEMRPTNRSWHSYTSKIDVSNIRVLTDQLKQVKAANWKVKVRYNPAIEYDELEEFLKGSHIPAQRKRTYLALRSRMDVYPNGDVVSCPLFPEMAVGNLHNSDAAEAWHGTKFDFVRESVQVCGLMPACAKCKCHPARRTKRDNFPFFVGDFSGRTSPE